MRMLVLDVCVRRVLERDADPRVGGTGDAPSGRVHEIGCTRWAIAEGYIPGWSHGTEHGSRVRAVMVQMPALNTPQFQWVKSRLPRKPQPVPPIFQPEVAARAIVWAAAHADREIWVGGSTVVAIAGNKVVPRVGGALATGALAAGLAGLAWARRRRAG